MSNIKRMTVSKNIVLSASADAVWEIVADWGGVAKWFPKGEPGSNLVECKLVGDKKTLPLTRILVLDSGMEVAETLTLRDDGRKRVQYALGDGVFPGIFNYSGFQTVDAEGPDSARLTLTVSFDLDAPDADPEAVRSQFEGMFEHVIFPGISAYIAAK